MARKTTDRTPPRGYLVVSTHWDREWYEPFQHYRFRLVDVLDGVLDLLEEDPAFTSFMTDGQTCVLEDYLAIRPENRPRLEQLVRAGRLQIGPWYTMPDEFLPCGESLVRNLLRGHQVAAGFGGVMKIGFVCDTFGHNSQMPQIFHGFDLREAAVWRGTNFPKHPGLFIWEAVDGSDVLTYAFESVGYGQYHFEVRLRHRNPDGSLDVDRAVDGVRRVFEIEQPRVPGRAILLFDGLDHMPAERLTSEIVRRSRAAGLDVVQATLAEYFEAVRAQKLPLKRFRGELRESAEKNGNVIPGVLSSRTHLKQLNAACESALLHWAEPAAALAALLGEEHPTEYLRLAWRYLLRNHAHDSICGCSIDQVHQDMMYRFDQCRLIAERVRRLSLRAVADRMRLPKIEGDEAYAITIFNPTSQARGEVIDFPLRFPRETKNRFAEWFGYEPLVGFRLFDAAGREIEYQRVEVDKTIHVKEYDPRAGFQHADREQVRVAARLDLPAFGWTTLVCKPCTDKVRCGGSQVLNDHAMANDRLKVAINPNGTIDLECRGGGAYRGLLAFEDRADIGDGWYHGTALNDEIFTSTGSAADIALVADGFALTTFRVRVVLNVPAKFEHDQMIMRRARRLTPLVITSYLTLRAGSPYLEVRTEVDNTVRDHRLRVLLPTGLKTAVYLADSPFDIVQRNVALRPDWYRLHEPELETKPQYSFTVVNDGRRGLAVISRGQPESAVRDLPDRPIALTLFRGFRRTVGTPGEPGGQMLGPTAHDYWLYPHVGRPRGPELCRLGQRLAAGLDWIYTEPARLPLRPPKPPLPPTGSWLSISDGPLVVTAVKQSEDGAALIVRLFNPTSRPARQRIEFLTAPSAAWQADLLERPVRRLAARGRKVAVSAGPKQILTLRVELPGLDP